MSERRSDRAVSILLSFLIHAAIVGALLWGWWRYRQPTPAPQTLAIEATVVRSAPPSAAPPTASPAPPSPPQPVAAPPQPPAPDPQAEERAQAERAAQEQVEQQQAQRQLKLEAEKKSQAEAEAAAEAKAQQQAEQQVKAEADQRAKAKADAEKKAQELAQQHKLEQERQLREAELRSQLAAEDHLNAVQSSPAKAEYLSLITAKINRAWIRPSSARTGIQCTVHLTQIPGGEITNVSVQGCNGDEAVRQSVESAAYKASPLPVPADSALFDANIDVTFAPDE